MIVGIDSSTSKWGCCIYAREAVPLLLGGLHDEDLLKSTRNMVEKIARCCTPRDEVVVAKPLEIATTPHINAILHHAFGLLQMALDYNSFRVHVVSESHYRSLIGFDSGQPALGETAYGKRKRIKKTSINLAERLGFRIPKEEPFADDIADACNLAYAHHLTTRSLFGNMLK